MTEKCILGIDTSNYKTSLAVVCGNQVVADLRRFLKVKEGQRGLRQSEALFQHVQNLPELFARLRHEFHGKIDAVAYSTRPRPVEGSYMPCFTAGVSQAVSIASALDIPAVGFSHQEGHIEAVLSAMDEKPSGDFLACHFSGGTCEVLKIEPGLFEPRSREHFENMNGEGQLFTIELIGGTRDISFGQVLDRAGVDMGLSFPCGQELDEMALQADSVTEMLTRIKAEDGMIHLSGFDTQLRSKLGELRKAGVSPDSLIREAFEKMADVVTRMLQQNAEKANTGRIIMSGGVSSSHFLREQVTQRLAGSGIAITFGSAELSSDNAVGTAFLGNRFLWDRNRSESDN